MTLIEKLKASINSVVAPEQLGSLREVIEALEEKGIIDNWQFLELTNTLAHKCNDMERELNDFRFKMQPKAVVNEFVPHEGCGKLAEV